jgi:hypothetical protein
MAVIGGINGVVNGKTNVAEWSIDYTSDDQGYSSSSTKLGTVVLAGNKDWNGSFRAYGNPPVALKPGSAFAFTGNMGNGKGAVGASMVSRVVVTIDIEGKRPIGYTCDFGANGALTLGVATATDVVVPTAHVGALAKVLYGAVGVTAATEIVDVRSVTITLAAANVSYVSSSTASETKRVQGPLT